MVDILSLPRRPKIKLQSKILGENAGLPINNLPGWEHIPLNSKLPMLKCPDNQVIFSKNKIGQSFKHWRQEFDPSGRDSYPEYNPLHDSNLKTFYSNERNLKRLRENGEITGNNDVICNLKDFNEYRQQLQKTQLYYILEELNRLEAEQRDRMLIANAESITNRDHKHLSARQHTYHEILARKAKLDDERQRKFERLLAKTQENFDRIAGMNEMKKVLADHKKLLNELKMKHHWEVSNDFQRKHLIRLKKLFQFKKERLKKNLRNLQESRMQRAQKAQTISWHKRLNERIENQEKMNLLLQEMSAQKKVFIENHRKKYQAKWNNIQDEIKKRSRAMRHVKKRRSRRKTEEERRRSSCQEYKEDFLEKMRQSEICSALTAAMNMDSDTQLPFNSDDPIYKAAKYIMNNIINTYTKDLSDDKLAFKRVYERINEFFEEATKFVTFRASQIIASTRDFIKQTGSPPPMSTTRDSKVSFKKISQTIGTSSYEIHPFIDVRPPNERTPTPAGSLASLVIDSHESLVGKIKTEHLNRNDMVFLEHYIIRFKRELIVGMGRRVFSAIRCHFENKIMDVRPELLDLEKDFLLKQVTYAILSYAKNPINFESSLQLCINALSSSIIWSLQKHLLKPTRDPRVIVNPSDCNKDKARMRLCLYCL